MEKRIETCEKNLIIAKILSYVFGTIMFISFFCVVGIAGSLECDIITIKQFILREIVALAITGASGFILNIIEMRIENLSERLHNLYYRRAMMKRKAATKRASINQVA